MSLALNFRVISFFSKCTGINLSQVRIPKQKEEKMSEKKSFTELKDLYLARLTQYVPIVDRVHGNHHPEFHDVFSVYKTMNKKITEAGAEQPDLEEEFSKLREITSNYTVPGGTCETYAAVYQMLDELDKAYER